MLTQGQFRVHVYRFPKIPQRYDERQNDKINLHKISGLS